MAPVVSNYDDLMKRYYDDLMKRYYDDLMKRYYDDLMKRYIDVCNQALMLNKDRFPFKQILGAAQKSEHGKVIEVHISGNISGISYAMTLDKNGRLTADPHSSCPDCKCDRKWTVKKSYLENVAKDPGAYIKNPAKIDWEWMYNRL